MNFADDISQYALQLIGKRDREWYKSQVELDRQVKRLREEKERADEALEMNMVHELKAYYRQQRKEFERQRMQIISKVKED